MKKLTLTVFGMYLALLLVVGVFASGCEPGGKPIIENQRGQEVVIQVIHVREDGTLGAPRNYGGIPARTTKKLGSITFVYRDWVYRIEAVDPSGKVVFSYDYNLDDLEKIKWKITIPPE
jgi:hypothetical protein